MHPDEVDDSILFNPANRVSGMEDAIIPDRIPCQRGPELLEKLGLEGRRFQIHLKICQECRQKYAN